MPKNQFQPYDASAIVLPGNQNIDPSQTCSENNWRQILVEHFRETKKCHFFNMPRRTNLDFIIRYKTALHAGKDVDELELPAEYALEANSANKAQFKNRMKTQYYIQPTMEGPVVFQKKEGKTTKHKKGGRPISNMVIPLESSWSIVTGCHEYRDQQGQIHHRNRDDTHGEVQKITCIITKALVRSFVDNCPTCSNKSVTKSARAGWDTKKRRGEGAEDDVASPEPQPKRRRKSIESPGVAPENLEEPLFYNPVDQQFGGYQQQPTFYQQPEAYRQQPTGFQNFQPQPQEQPMYFNQPESGDVTFDDIGSFYQIPEQSFEQHTQQEQYQHNNSATMENISAMQQQMPFAEQMPNNNNYQPEINWFHNPIDAFTQQQLQNFQQAPLPVDPALQEKFTDLNLNLDFPFFAELMQNDNENNNNHQLEINQPNDLPQSIDETSANSPLLTPDTYLDDILGKYLCPEAEQDTEFSAYLSEENHEAAPEFNNTANQQSTLEDLDMEEQMEADLYAAIAKMEVNDKEEEEPTTESASSEVDLFTELFETDPDDTPEDQQTLSEIDMVLENVNFTPAKPKESQSETKYPLPTNK